MSLALNLSHGLLQRASGFSISGLLGASTAAGYWNQNIATALWQELSRTTQAGDTDTCRVIDSAGGGAGQMQTATGMTVAVSGAITSLDYSNVAGEQMTIPSIDFTSLDDCLIMIAFKADPTDTAGALIRPNNPVDYYGHYQSGSALTDIDPNGTRYLDGSSSTATTRGEWFTEAVDDAWHIYELRSADISAATGVTIPANTVRGLGTLGPVLVAPMSLVSGSLDAIRTEIGAEVGLSI